MTAPAAPSSHSAPTAVASALVAMVSFQVGASFAKSLIPAIGAPGTTAIRLGLSAAIVCALQRPWRTVPSRQAWPVVAAFGLSLGAMNFVFYEALKTIPLGVAVALEFTGPLGVAVFASRQRLDYLWAALAAAGLAVLLPIGPARGAALDPVGVAYALAAGVGWALYIVLGQKAGRAHGASASTWGLVVAALLTVPLGLADAGARPVIAALLPFGLGVAIFSSALPYTLEMVALRRLSAKTFGTLMSFEPAIAALAGAALLHERLTGVQYAAIAAVVVASAGAVSTEPALDDTPPSQAA